MEKSNFQNDPKWTRLAFGFHRTVSHTGASVQEKVGNLGGEVNQLLDGAPLPQEVTDVELQEAAKLYRRTTAARKELAAVEGRLFGLLDSAMAAQEIKVLEVSDPGHLDFEIRRKAKQNTRIDQAAVEAVLNHEDPRYHPVNATGRNPFTAKWGIAKKIMDLVQAENGDYFNRVLAPCMTVADGKSEIKIVVVEAPAELRDEDLSHNERARRAEEKRIANGKQYNEFGEPLHLGMSRSDFVAEFAGTRNMAEDA